MYISTGLNSDRATANLLPLFVSEHTDPLFLIDGDIASGLNSLSAFLDPLRQRWLCPPFHYEGAEQRTKSNNGCRNRIEPRLKYCPRNTPTKGGEQHHLYKKSHLFTPTVLVVF
ncbi:protein of unknown function [Cupriavidus neocaledonicus]|uniref:Uncharacterized protein n=1 Tax=Cupriavidus neocaledonicus TaxID=1040979 RepID=A0A375H6D7_9BURK|nr:protein of unknown function [Cupriavidus neocaledonicus]